MSREKILRSRNGAVKIAMKQGTCRNVLHLMLHVLALQHQGSAITLGGIPIHSFVFSSALWNISTADNVAMMWLHFNVSHTSIT